MTRKETFEKIFVSSFDDGERWRRWFIDALVNDEDILFAEDVAGRTSATLLMQHYNFMYQEDVLSSSYISCVATLPEARSRGVASHLMVSALAESRKRGDTLCTLIPASESLYYFYRRFEFARTFYLDRMRYSALHSFTPHGEEITPSYGLFHELEQKFGCGVLHSAADYNNILNDMTLDGGEQLIAVEDGSGSAMLFACSSDEGVRVKLLMADSEALADGALALLRSRVGNKHIEVFMPPLSGNLSFLVPRGMVRIVDPLPLLSALAAAHPSLSYSIDVRDGLLSENSGRYVLDGGMCRREEAVGRARLDVSVDTLAAVLFSNHATGNIFDLPARRPLMALMLD